MNRNTSNMIKDTIKLRNSIIFAEFSVMMNTKKGKTNNRAKI